MLQILNLKFNICYRSLVMPFLILLLMAINVLSDFATIRLFGEPGFIGFPMTGLATGIIILDVIPASYKIIEGSEVLFSSILQANVPGSVIYKFVSSCQPLRIQVGAFFSIKRITVMTFLGIIIDNAITLLLM